MFSSFDGTNGCTQTEVFHFHFHFDVQKVFWNGWQTCANVCYVSVCPACMHVRLYVYMRSARKIQFSDSVKQNCRNVIVMRLLLLRVQTQQHTQFSFHLSHLLSLSYWVMKKWRYNTSAWCAVSCEYILPESFLSISLALSFSHTQTHALFPFTFLLSSMLLLGNENWQDHE